MRSVFIQPEYSRLIRTGSRFYNASGLTVSGSLPDLKIQMDKVREKQEYAMVKAQEYTIYFMALLALLLILSFFISLQAFTLFGSIAALLTLTLGLITPILMVTIHKEVEYLGDIVLSFESKGVIGSIVKLWETGDMVVALVILLFSVVVPVLKVLSLLIVSIFMQSRFAHGIIAFFKMIGKWSMVDVFVVAVFLVYLTANKGDVSKAEVLRLGKEGSRWKVVG